MTTPDLSGAAAEALATAAAEAAAAVLPAVEPLTAGPAQPGSPHVTAAFAGAAVADLAAPAAGRSAPSTKRPAVALIKHGRKVMVGDVVDVWFDITGDKVPDLHVSGNAFSEFTVHLTTSFTKDGKDISSKDCARLAMGGQVSKVRLFPACVGSPLSFAVAVKSSRDGSPKSGDDWAPAFQKFTKKVLTAPLT